MKNDDKSEFIYDSTLKATGSLPVLSLIESMIYAPSFGKILTIDDLDNDGENRFLSNFCIEARSTKLIEGNTKIPMEFLRNPKHRRALLARLLLQNTICYIYDTEKAYGFLATQNLVLLRAYLKSIACNDDIPDKVQDFARSSFQELRDGMFSVVAFHCDYPNYYFCNRNIDFSSKSSVLLTPYCVVEAFRTQLLQKVSVEKTVITFLNENGKVSHCETKHENVTIEDFAVPYQEVSDPGTFHFNEFIRSTVQRKINIFSILGVSGTAVPSA